MWNSKIGLFFSSAIPSELLIRLQPTFSLMAHHKLGYLVKRLHRCFVLSVTVRYKIVIEFYSGPYLLNS